MTRVAASGPEMWTEITRENSAEVVRALREVSRRMLAVAEALEADDEESVRAFFQAAHQEKRKLLSKDGGERAD